MQTRWTLMGVQTRRTRWLTRSWTHEPPWFHVVHIWTLQIINMGFWFGIPGGTAMSWSRACSMAASPRSRRQRWNWPGRRVRAALSHLVGLGGGEARAGGCMARWWRGPECSCTWSPAAHLLPLNLSISGFNSLVHLRMGGSRWSMVQPVTCATSPPHVGRLPCFLVDY
jgi:hypothetical protein